jgi:hypothetical protein
MKTFFQRNTQYSIILKLSIILSEIIFICLFYFFPKLTPAALNKFNDPIIVIDEIPITIQPAIESMQSPIPPQILIADEIEEPDLLADILIIVDSKTNSLSGVEYPVVNASLSAIPKSPRQTLEVLPEQNEENISGSIKLSLKISETGNVIDHKILINNLECEGCLSKILAAAYKSRWESGKESGIAAEFWVEKTYSFY